MSMSPLRPSKLSSPSNDNSSFMGGYIQFLNNGSTTSTTQSPMPSIRNDRTILPSKDIVIKKLPKTKPAGQTEKMERRKSISKVRKSPSKSSHKSSTKLLVNQSIGVPSAEVDQIITLTVSSKCDKQLRLCIEDVGNQDKFEHTTESIRTTSPPTPPRQYLFNGNNIAYTSHTFSKIPHFPHHSTDYNNSAQRSGLKIGDEMSLSLLKNISHPKKTILAPPILQPSKLKHNGDTQLFSDNLLATVAAEKITLNNYASRPTQATTAKTATVAINQFKKPNGNEVTNFLANPSIIKTK